MSRIFTDDDGNKYKLVQNLPIKGITLDTYSLKPIEPQEPEDRKYPTLKDFESVKNHEFTGTPETLVGSYKDYMIVAYNTGYNNAKAESLANEPQTAPQASPSGVLAALQAQKDFNLTPVEPEWEVKLKALDSDVMDFNFVVDAFVRTNLAQAEAIKEAIEATLQYIYGDGWFKDMANKVEVAATLIQKGKS